MQIQKTSPTTNTESSVLFSLASLGAMAKPAPVETKPIAKVEDLLGIGAMPSPVLAAPVVTPVVITKAPGASTRTWIVCATILAIGILGGSYAAGAALRRPVVAPAPVIATAPIVAPIAATVPIAPATTEERVPAAIAPAPDPVVAPVAPRPHRVDPVVRAATPPSAPIAPPSSEHLTLEQLIARAAPSGSGETLRIAPPSASPPPPSRPATPARADVVAAMTRIAPDVAQCGPEHGTAVVQLTVAHTGRVTSALVTGPLAGTAAGSCIARAARAATFPAFERDTFTLNYPFRI